ncbi:MAG: transglycosylase SLT domain-containing protein, partial [Myxococcota bacterium]|nr:transglycosylase SLT domain-containing protein [Myxococcota bacterium]
MWFFLSLLLAGSATAADTVPEQALTALRKGDCRTVTRLTQGLQGLAPAIARARCGMYSGLENQLGTGPAELEVYARLMLAREQILTNPQKVLELLDSSQSAPGTAGLEIQLLRARALSGSGKENEAVDQFRALFKTELAPEARYWMAWNAELKNETEEALDTYRAAWALHPTSPWAFKAEQHIEALGAQAIDLGTPKGRINATVRARNLVKGHQAERAMPLYDALQMSTGDESGQWIHERAMAAFAAKDYPLAISLFKKLKPMKSGTHGGAETLYHYALAISRTGNYADAAKAYRRLAQSYPKTRRADTASYKLGYLAWDSGELEQAIELFKKHLNARPKSRHAAETKWFIGFSHLRLDQREPARAWLSRVHQEHPDSGLASASLYWKARLLGMNGDTSAEQAALEALLESHPISGHAWYAAERLQKTYTGIDHGPPPAVPDSFVAKHDSARVAQALLDLGHLDWARDHARTLIGPTKKLNERSTSLAVAGLLAQTGAYVDAQSLVRGSCASNPKRCRKDAITICFPTPEQDVVTQSAQTIHPLLSYAVMTAESSLQPEVTSPAGARGLMQLMPDLGEELHKEVLDTAYDADWLYSPGYNAWLGTRELDQLEKEYDGRRLSPHLPLAIAAYNGGADAVNRWLMESPE